MGEGSRGIPGLGAGWTIVPTTSVLGAGRSSVEGEAVVISIGLSAPGVVGQLPSEAH